MPQTGLKPKDTKGSSSKNGTTFPLTTRRKNVKGIQGGNRYKINKAGKLRENSWPNRTRRGLDSQPSHWKTRQLWIRQQQKHSQQTLKAPNTRSDAKNTTHALCSNGPKTKQHKNIHNMYKWIYRYPQNINKRWLVIKKKHDQPYLVLSPQRIRIRRPQNW